MIASGHSLDHALILQFINASVYRRQREITARLSGFKTLNHFSYRECAVLGDKVADHIPHRLTANYRPTLYAKGASKPVNLTQAASVLSACSPNRIVSLLSCQCP